MKARRFSLAALAFACAAALAPPAGAQEVVTLRVGHVAPPTSSFQQVGERFDRHLQELSNGTLKVQLFGGAQLGGIAELWAQTRAGSIDGHLADLVAIQLLRSGRDFNVLTVPYLFRDRNHWRAFTASEVMRDMAAAVERGEGFKLAGYLGDQPARALSTRAKAVRSVEDMRGLKVRVPEAPPFIAAFRAFGASPTPVKAADLYEALSSGLVDGQDNGIVDVVAAGYTAVQKYYVPIDYMFTGLALWMNGRRFEALTPQQQGWIADAAKRTATERAAGLARDTDAAYAAAKAKGMEVVADLDLKGFREAGAKVAAESEGKAFAAGLPARIGAVR